MRGLKVTLFILALVVFGTQTFRHVYVKWIEPRGSVLDDFREKVEDEIAASEDLDDLLAQYKVAHGRLKEYESGHPEIEVRERSAQQLYTEEQQLQSAIMRVEQQEKSIFDLWFYWLCGLLSIGLGVLAYRRLNRWLGMVGIITGFTEMATWTSPLWRTWGPQGEFERLLTLKLVLSLVSMALLIGLWLCSDKESGSGASA
jgi:hypothetical protein